jgi:hypothetical protein
MSNSVRTEFDVGTTSVPLAPPTLSAPARLAVARAPFCRREGGGCGGLLAGILVRRFGQRPQFRDTFLRLLTPPPTMTEPQRVMGNSLLQPGQVSG